MKTIHKKVCNKNSSTTNNENDKSKDNEADSDDDSIILLITNQNNIIPEGYLFNCFLDFCLYGPLNFVEGSCVNFQLSSLVSDSSDEKVGGGCDSREEMK